MKKILALVAALSVIVSLASAGTIAYLTDTKSAKNTMTMGNVSIEQNEYKDKELTEKFEDADLYPGQTLGKYVTVTNTGKSDAYVRTFVAFEKGTDDNWKNVIEYTKNENQDEWKWSDKTYSITVGGVDYEVLVADYAKTLTTADDEKTTPASLYTVAMKASATNDDVKAFGEEYTVLVMTQAVQTAGFANAGAAFDAAFGVLGKDTVASWFGEEVENLPIPVKDPESLQDALKKAKTGDTIIFAADIMADLVMPSGVNNLTIDGNGNKLNGYINLNGAEGATIKGLTFDAQYAKPGYDRGVIKRYYGIILTGDYTNNPIKGAMNLTIDDCTFTGNFAKGGASVVFVDQDRSSGNSGNVTIKNCTFNTQGFAYCDIYSYYTGNGYFVIENNTFKSATQNRPVYLNKYQSSTPVVVKGNAFETEASLEDAVRVRDDSDDVVSVSAEKNTFAAVTENP